MVIVMQKKRRTERQLELKVLKIMSTESEFRTRKEEDQDPGDINNTKRSKEQKGKTREAQRVTEDCPVIAKTKKKKSMK